MKLYKIITWACCAVILIAGCRGISNTEKQEKPESSISKLETLKIQNLLRDSLALAEGVELVMSHLEIPKNTTLPSHYHPGEEFVYMLEGSGELSLEGLPKRLVKAGEVIKIPFKHVHSFSTLDEGAIAIVFRVHEKGQPDRFLIE